MAQTPEYKRGYQNGYNARARDLSKMEQRHMAEVRAVAERAERAEGAAGIGHCENCQHWNQLQPSYSWGNCMATKAPGTPWGCWAQAEETVTRRTVQISTSPQFGCVLFLGRTTATQPPSCGGDGGKGAP